MNRVITFAALAAIFAAAIPVNAVADSKDQILAAQKLMVRQKYPEAAAQVREVLKSDPNNIDALYQLVAIEQTRISDYESYAIEGKRFNVFADSLQKILDARQPRLKGADSLRCLFYRANILGGVGLIHAKRGAFVEGARNAMASQGMYKQIKKIDPGHLGADLGLGVFDYYFGTSMKNVPFVASGSVEKGIEAIDRALKAPFPYNNAAKSSYCWILIDRKQFKKADSLARSALVETPGTTIFLRIRALIALWTGGYGDALLMGGKLMAASEARQPVNWSDLITSYYIRTSACENLGQKAEACAAAEKGLALPMPEGYKNMPHIKDHLKYLSGVRSKCGAGKK